MENNSPVTRTADSCLKLQPTCCPCPGCIKRIKKTMLKVDGVHSIKVNANEGTIEVNSEIDPQVLITMAAKAGKKAELLWERKPESSQNIPASEPSSPPSPVATSSGLTSQVQVNNIDRFDQTVHLQEFIDKNAGQIKHLEIVDKRVIKFAFKDSGVHSTDSPSPITPPPSSDGGEAGGLAGGTEVAPPPHSPSPPPATATAATPSSLTPPEIKDEQPVNPPVAEVNCSAGRYSCRVM